MEEMQKKKFVCKFCNKKYHCGKALGGHIRTHMNQKSAKDGEEQESNANVVKFQSVGTGKKNKRDSGYGTTGCNSGYGLRENPRRTWRLVDSGTTSQQERVCKECGKGFQSLKALCGHMACHSEKEKLRSEFQDHSKTIRYKSLDAYPSAYTLANGSSSVSEIDQKQEEAAMCLMMFSRDSGCRGSLNSEAEISNSNSVVLEAKSSSVDVRITMADIRDYVSNINKLVKLRKQRNELKTAEICLSDSSDSGYFGNGPKKDESDVSVDGSVTGAEFKKTKLEYTSRTGAFDAELGKSSNKFRCVRSELGKELITKEGYGQVGGISMCNLRMRPVDDSYSPELLGGSNKKIKNVSSNVESCKNAQMCFQSRRALEPRRAGHTRINGCCETIDDSGENGIDTDSLPVPKPCGKTTESCSVKTSTKQSISGHSKTRLGPKRSKGHECPICFRVFRSGQALGGHKRSHFFGGSEDRTIVIKQEHSELRGLIDLNLPAPIEEEETGHAASMPW
ncbi:Zinc finger protein ZAT4 [Morella rubra]|uniref:Zinc finger protein ZAT4 n=1 Tax=Morella rubra TaxID=262757 RepID=A0A6A1WDQ1_9ROSI|nr:Zinc finger protein ZAT4 [Morella rubra]